MPNLKFDTTKLKEQIEDNPLVAASIAVVGLQAVSKLMNANTQRRNSKTYAKEVDRRIKKSHK